MAALSSKLRSVAFDMSGNRTGIAFFCPGCQESHAIATHGATAPIWQWDGNVDAPSVQPSINVTSRRGDIQTICHSFVRAGQIEFLGDCTHALAGQIVPIPDWPRGDEADFYLSPPHDKAIL